MSDNRKTNKYNYSYVDGSTVRKLQPQYQPEPQRRERPEPSKRDLQREETIRRKREKFHVIDFKYAVVIVCACALITCFALQYLQVQSQITSQKNEIVSMQKELEQLNNENVAKEEELNSSVDLNKIYQVASVKLGMKYADSAHTIVYESANPDYVKQYHDIPKDK